MCTRDKGNSLLQNNGAQQLASEATVHIVLEDVNDEIPLFTEREQETVLEGEPVGSKVTQVNAIDKDGTFPNNKVSADHEYPFNLLHEIPLRVNVEQPPDICHFIWRLINYTNGFTGYFSFLKL